MSDTKETKQPEQSPLEPAHTLPASYTRQVENPRTKTFLYKPVPLYKMNLQEKYFAVTLCNGK